ncbi:pleckstrin homology domain-containing family A member 4 [Octodon degus]|uniref:Pleckstrin homology domain-containing family A member 4 n=1 Tax=Octodon degus TaxID=10160 RepID=A0A6P6DR46_OCTDE|nr:pleckstrin homology domain-containing family A member 4 [Octodon degus]
MEEGRPRSSLSLASSASTVSSLSTLSAKKPTRAINRVHAFGKRSNALRRDPNLPVHIRGWLHKQDSSGLRLWKRRWFVLSGHCLFYYKDSREESVLGSVLLPSYSVRPDGPGAPRGRRFTFTAEHPGMRTYVLAADTVEDLRGWLRALGRASRAEGDDWCVEVPAMPQTSFVSGIFQTSPWYEPGPPLDSTFHQSLETDSLLTRLCGQDQLLRRLQGDIDQKQEEKEQLEAALELTRQQLGQATREAAAPGRAWGRQRLLQDRLVSVRAALCHLTQERERVWDTYRGLEQELGTLRETLEYLLHLGSPQDRAAAQQQLWMVEDTLAGLGAPQKAPPHTEPDLPSPAPRGEESSERESLPETLELGSPRSPEVDWGRPPGGDRDLGSPRSGLASPRVSRASSPEGHRTSSPPLGTKVPAARPRMSAQEQLERMRRNQDSGRPLLRPASPRLLTLGRTLSPARRQPDTEQRAVLGAAKWLRSSGSWSSPRNTSHYLTTSDGHREQVLSLSQALATEASQWHRLMTASPGGNLDCREGPGPPVAPSDPTPEVTSPPRSPAATNSGSSGFSPRGSGRGGGPAPWAPTWDSGDAPPGRDEGAWPLRVTLLQSSF